MPTMRRRGRRLPRTPGRNACGSTTSARAANWRFTRPIISSARAMAVIISSRPRGVRTATCRARPVRRLPGVRRPRRRSAWEYLYIPQSVFERLRTATIHELADTCRPALQNLIEAETLREDRPLFALLAEADEKKPEIEGLVSAETLNALPERYRKAVEQAATLFRLCENKAGFNFAPVFSALLGSVDEAAKGLVVRRLAGDVPREAAKQRAWFDVYLPGNLDGGKRRHYEGLAQNLKRTLVFSNGISLLGLVRELPRLRLERQHEAGRRFRRREGQVQGGRRTRIAGHGDPRQRIPQYAGCPPGARHQRRKLAQRELIVWIEALPAVRGGVRDKEESFEPQFLRSHR